MPTNNYGGGGGGYQQLPMAQSMNPPMTQSMGPGLMNSPPQSYGSPYMNTTHLQTGRMATNVCFCLSIPSFTLRYWVQWILPLISLWMLHFSKHKRVLLVWLVGRNGLYSTERCCVVVTRYMLFCLEALCFCLVHWQFFCLDNFFHDYYLSLLLYFLISLTFFLSSSASLPLLHAWILQWTYKLPTWCEDYSSDKRASVWLLLRSLERFLPLTLPTSFLLSLPSKLVRMPVYLVSFRILRKFRIRTKRRR